jgi:hypothetical protein
MGKKLKITEDQLKRLVENKNRKIVSEQPEDQNINRDYELIYLVRGGSNNKSILRSKRTKKIGLYSEKYKWMLQPDFVETDIDLMGEGEDAKIITEFTNSDGKKFYIMYPVSMGMDMDTPNVEVLNQKQYAELGHEFQSIKPNEEPSTEMGNTDKVYEEGDMDEMGMKEDGMMNESIKGYKTEFDRFLKKPKQ